MAAPAPDGRPTLRRGIGTVGFFALAIGSMIGVGWVTALGGWLGSAGPGGAMLGFAGGGLLMLFIGLCYAELTSMLPVAGGEVAYAYKAFGTAKSFLVGWLLAFGYIAVSAFEAISVGRVLGFLLPHLERFPVYEIGGEPVFGTHLVLAALLTAAVTWVNYRSVKGAARVQTWLMGGFVAVALVFIVAGLWQGDFARVEPWFAGDSTLARFGGIAAVFATAPFWFVGFDTIPQGAEEADGHMSPRVLGTMIIASIVVATLFYCVLILSVASTGPWQDLVGADLPTATAFQRAFRSPLLADLVLIAALIGLLTSWNGFFLAGSRVLFALGRGAIVPQWIGRTHARHGSPAAAVLLTGALTFAGALLGRGAMVALIDVGSFCIAAAFFGVSLSARRLRATHPAMHRPYRMPMPSVVPWIAVAGATTILAVMVVPGSPAALVWPLEWGILGAVLGLGLAFWLAGRRGREAVDESSRAGLILGEFAD